MVKVSSIFQLKIGQEIKIKTSNNDTITGVIHSIAEFDWLNVVVKGGKVTRIYLKWIVSIEVQN